MNAAHRFDNEKRRRPEHHARQAMLTPAYVLEPLRELLGGFDLDPCTEPDNPTNAHKFFSPPSDGCALPWDAQTIFCNPPYGEARDRWVDRCIAEAPGKRIVLLIPAHPDTRTFQKAMRTSTSILFTKGRLKFGVLRENGRQEAASHGSALFGFNVDLSPLAALGTVVPGAAGANAPLLHIAPAKNADLDTDQLLDDFLKLDPHGRKVAKALIATLVRLKGGAA